jgi:predicted extracellular nuclease
MHPSTQRRVLSLLLILTVALSLAPLAAAAPAAPQATTLAAGDIAIVGYNADDPDQFAFVLLTNVTAGTQVNFTDNGWLANGAFRTGEGTTTWTAPTDLCAGTIVDPGVGTMQFSASGDQVLAYQGASAAPVFIYALNNEGAGVWQSDATSANTSALPSGLSNGATAVALDEIDNAVYNEVVTSGAKAALLAAISNKSNWNGSDTVRQTMPTGPYTVTDAPPCGTGDLPPTVTTTTPANGAPNVAVNTNIAIGFSESVDVTANAFTLECPTGTPVAFSSTPALPAAGITGVTLDPTADLPLNTTCTVTVVASQVTDTDGTPQQMAADHVFSFTTVAANVCNTAFTPIYSIQGSGSSAAITGAVTTQGVVVGDFEGPSPALRGFYLQDLAGDSDPATSDGIFVFNGDTDSVTLGDVVRVTGSAEEFQNQTQISSVSSILPCGVGSVTPVDVSLPFSAADYPERYEGMLVRLPQTLYVTEHFQLGRFGQAVLTSRPDRLQQPTNVTTPGAAALALQAANNLDRIILDDQTNSQNPDPIAFGRGALPLSASNTLRGGDSAAGIVGVLTYTWSGNAASGNAYRLRPIGALNGGAINFAAANPRPASPTVGGRLRVTAANLLNYFNTFGNGNCQLGVGGGATNCRGANDAAEFARQWPKTVANLVNGGADVIGIMEIENDGYGASSAIQDLVNQLNSATAAGTYAFIDADALTSQTNALGVDAIKVGLIYKPGKVTPVGTTAALNSVAFVNGGDSAARNRPALAQAFQEISSGERFIVVVNHLKSKGSACNAPDADDGQGNCNGVRTAAATLMTAWLAGNPTGTGDPDIMIMGDLNSYAQEDPITAIKSAGYVNLIESRLGVSAYSYAFDGQWGYLDHALATAALDAQVVGAQEWHINADEPSVLDYNTEFKTPGQITSLYAADQFRSSDHDPVIIGLNLRNPLAITLAGFEAQGLGDRIAVSWETVSEIDNAGFNLYRTGAFAEQPEQDDLLAYLPSQGPGSAQGFVYSYDDLAVQPGESWWYWLEDVSLSGVTTLHGPVSATASAPTAVRLSSVSATPAVAGSALLPWLLAAGGAGALLALGRRRR